MTSAEIAAVMAEHQRWWMSGGTEGARAHLRGADLRWADLRGADLREADLRGVDLRGANLSGANLTEANLGQTQILQLGPVGSRRDYLTVKRFENGEIEAMTGCFRGSLEDLELAVAQTHAENPRYRRDYEAAITYARTVLGLEVSA